MNLSKIAQWQSFRLTILGSQVQIQTRSNTLYVWTINHEHFMTLILHHMYSDTKNYLAEYSNSVTYQSKSKTDKFRPETDTQITCGVAEVIPYLVVQIWYNIKTK